jgi:hypothetical protein
MWATNHQTWGFEYGFMNKQMEIQPSKIGVRQLAMGRYIVQYCNF